MIHYTMASRKRQHEELSDEKEEDERENEEDESESEADTVILTDDDERDEPEDIKNLVQFFNFTELGEQVCVDVKNGMSQEDVIAKHRAKYLEEMDGVMEKVLDVYEKLRKLEIFNYMTVTNEHLEEIRGGDYDQYWVEAYNIHKKKFLHPQVDRYIIHHIAKCAEEQKDVTVGYRSKYFFN